MFAKSAGMVVLPLIILNYVCPLVGCASSFYTTDPITHPPSPFTDDPSKATKDASMAGAGLRGVECECEYYRLEGYYIWHNFTQHENYSHRQIHLNPNGRLQYRCLLSIPKCHNSKLLHVSGRSSRIPEVFTQNNNQRPTGLKPARNFCEGLQIGIDTPFTSTGNENVSEEAHVDTENRKLDREVYVVWLNISHFDQSIEGDYWFYAKQPSSDNVLCRHRLTMTLHQLKKEAHPSTESILSPRPIGNQPESSIVPGGPSPKSSIRVPHKAIVLLALGAILIAFVVTFFAFQNRLRAMLTKSGQCTNPDPFSTTISFPDSVSETTKTLQTQQSSGQNSALNSDNSTFQKSDSSQKNLQSFSALKNRSIDSFENCYPL